MRKRTDLEIQLKLLQEKQQIEKSDPDSDAPGNELNLPEVDTKLKTEEYVQSVCNLVESQPVHSDNTSTFTRYLLKRDILMSPL